MRRTILGGLALLGLLWGAPGMAACMHCMAWPWRCAVHGGLPAFVPFEPGAVRIITASLGLANVKIT
jgi:hypothetical protein